MRPEPRDKNILSVVNDYGVVSSTQIAEWFFPGVAKTTALRRIRALHKGKYLEACVPLDDGTKTFCLGVKGKEALGESARYIFSNRNTIHHDVTISAIRRKLEFYNLAKEVTLEFVLKSELFRNTRFRQAKDQHIPDALMVEVIHGNGKAIALEVELTVKSENRYRRIFADYNAKPSIYRVWYFVRSWREGSRILTIADRLNPNFKPKLWISVVGDFVTAEMLILFAGIEGRKLFLNEIAFTEMKTPEKPTQGSAYGMSTLISSNSQFKNEVNSVKPGANLRIKLDAAFQ